MLKDVASDRDLLEIVMNRLFRWANESESGGWSPHQVEPQRSLASRIAEHLATTATRQEPSAVWLAEGILVALKCPRGSEAQIRCLEEIGHDAACIVKSDATEPPRLGEKGDVRGTPSVNHGVDSSGDDEIARLQADISGLLNALIRYRVQHDQNRWPADRPCDCHFCQQANEAIKAAKGC